MSLNDEERTLLVEFEIEKAHKLIDQFSILENAELWDTLANRVYYAVFHAVTALLIKNGLHAGSHQGVSVLFNKHFVKENLIDEKYGRLLARLENMREKSDYTCLFETTEDEVLPMIPQAKEMVSMIDNLIKPETNS
ncbi:MAG: HEPN domain-containing protein [Bacteroidales bacterium]|nr:HEPN domain-containing protein [Bacteroidales bacterium]